jgi:co-chaperonin GroES (HSP10)
MKAINYYLIVEKVKEGPRMVGGLELTDKVDDSVRYLKAKVISAGNLVEGVKDDDIIYYDRHAGHGVQVEETLYQVIRIQDIVLAE